MASADRLGGVLTACSSSGAIRKRRNPKLSSVRAQLTSAGATNVARVPRSDAARLANWASLNNDSSEQRIKEFSPAKSASVASKAARGERASKAPIHHGAPGSRITREKSPACE